MFDQISFFLFCMIGLFVNHFPISSGLTTTSSSGLNVALPLDWVT
jgi:hypothetical protein